MFVLLQRRLAWTINFAMLVSFCALASHWTWVFFSPDQVALLPREETAREGHAEGIAGGHLFGTMMQAQLPPGLKLDGIFSPGRGKPGAAIFLEQGKGSQVFLAGEQISPGIFLDEIAGDHVVLAHHGEKTVLRLEEIAPPLDLSAK